MAQHTCWRARHPYRGEALRNRRARHHLPPPGGRQTHGRATGHSRTRRRIAPNSGTSCQHQREEVAGRRPHRHHHNTRARSRFPLTNSVGRKERVLAHLCARAGVAPSPSRMVLLASQLAVGTRRSAFANSRKLHRTEFGADRQFARRATALAFAAPRSYARLSIEEGVGPSRARLARPLAPAMAKINPPIVRPEHGSNERHLTVRAFGWCGQKRDRGNCASRQRDPAASAVCFADGFPWGRRRKRQCRKRIHWHGHARKSELPPPSTGRPGVGADGTAVGTRTRDTSAAVVHSRPGGVDGDRGDITALAMIGPPLAAIAAEVAT
eukprot:scaffold326353_cov55-Tisochrysis_lutea.AAC.6